MDNLSSGLFLVGLGVLALNLKHCDIMRAYSTPELFLFI